MKKSIKAALLSGLVFPGTGYFSLNHPRRGLACFIPSLLSVIFLIHHALGKAYAIAGQIERGAINGDTATVTNLILTPPTAQEMLQLNIATWVIILCWGISIVDSFRLGHHADQQQKQ